MQTDSNQLDGNHRRRPPDKAVWLEICTTFENTVLVFERVTNFVSTSPWASHTTSMFESRTHEAHERLAHLRAAVIALEKPGTTSMTAHAVQDVITLPDGAFDTEELAMRDLGAAPAQSAYAKVSSEPTLTAREREVAVLIAKGRSNRQIADALVLVPGTVANHVAHILGKLDCANRAQVAAWTVRKGLLKDDSLG